MAKILVVDDEMMILELVEEFLKEKNHTVEKVWMGEEVLNKIKEKKPDLILLDIKLGEEDGREILKAIKKYDPALKVVIISGVLDESYIHDAKKLGAVAHIYKPFSLEQLNDIIKRVL